MKFLIEVEVIFQLRVVLKYSIYIFQNHWTGSNVSNGYYTDPSEKKHNKVNISDEVESRYFEGRRCVRNWSNSIVWNPRGSEIG